MPDPAGRAATQLALERRNRPGFGASSATIIGGQKRRVLVSDFHVERQRSHGLTNIAANRILIPVAADGHALCLSTTLAAYPATVPS
jgi:hypothetical protein